MAPEEHAKKLREAWTAVLLHAHHLRDMDYTVFVDGDPEFAEYGDFASLSKLTKIGIERTEKL